MLDQSGDGGKMLIRQTVDGNIAFIWYDFDAHGASVRPEPAARFRSSWRIVQ
jgi:hypothetical protein